jgi:hypothetical protein
VLALLRQIGDVVLFGVVGDQPINQSQTHVRVSF